MTTSTHLLNTPTAAETSSASLAIIRWLKNGFSLFLKAPFKLFFFLLSALIVEGLFQVLPSAFSIPISKIAIILFTAAIWPILANLDKHKVFSLKCAFASKGWFKMFIVSPLFLLPFISQVLSAFLLFGEKGASLLLYGEMMDISAVMLGFIFATGAPALIALSFVVPRILLSDDSVFKAIESGFKMVLTAWKAMSIILIINALVLFLAPITFALSALLLGPVLVCINYVAYNEILKIHKD
jgi:hypothetical protein